eukprot:9360464-Alexandrium_andersonii.AAC.1
MSASLVGSEMCIRDSSRTVWAPCLPVLPRSASIPPSLADLRVVRSLGPVSYTHLTLPTICSV